jgi:Ras-related protein Rab-7A
MTQLDLSNAGDFPFLLFGNKADLPNKAVQPSAAREYAEINGGMLFYEVSAKTGDNIQTGFEAVVKKALEQPFDDDFLIRRTLPDEESKRPSSGGMI